MSLLAASAIPDLTKMGELLATDPDIIHERDAETNASPLHYAAQTGSLAAVELLLQHGHPWNEVTFTHKTAAEFALAQGHNHIWDRLLNEGIRVEMLLAILGKGEQDSDTLDLDEETKAKLLPVDASDYLNKKLTYSEDGSKLLDEDGNGVMMGWEAPLMERHAMVIAPAPGKSVLNVGFGLGIIDTYLQERGVAQHTIIEAHPDVYAFMLKQGWDKKPGVKILFGRWQDVVDQLEVYDGIFFDTFGEDYDALKEFHELLPNILAEDGIYSYFNGLSGSNPFFHEVSCAICESDLQDMGIETSIEKIDMGSLGDEVWDGVRRAYWTLPIYNLPTCLFSM
ncbi:S-adenosyl-L-methionine-dependent methyltransferase [Rhizoclosmatium globosum]|uniref:Arginine N-methyltransferase 2 n=1 Tax=Rhizoclosmatium globosum TaxID=329046 RepID=A0A1Y2BXV6_9FUNG|nr:S-adenosyl-L-methionine-dependent methyltransferase [Rhizoclosmatium globosum]|eukprot:ORY38915.1 S-adenosyl-L-methionine-dependent methyltransferase [Rhizoclosmatium globosum]